jgi:hypothetical protein
MDYQKTILINLTRIPGLKNRLKNLVFAVFVFLVSCSLQEVKEISPTVNRVNNNSRFRINLPEEHTSGYLWQLKSNYDMTKIIQLNSVWHGA